MDVAQLPDITSVLVTPDNPPREDIAGIDYERCAALHNYLVQYGWLAEGRPLAALTSSCTTFFTTAFGDGADAEALRPRMDPSLAAFLDAAMIPPATYGPDELPAPQLSIFAWGISPPSLFVEEFIADLQNLPADSLLRLYGIDLCLSAEGSGGGVVYHQDLHRVGIFMHLDDYDYGFPAKENTWVWNPLETLLSHWIDLIRLGKVVASPHREPSLYDFEKIGPWEWRPYSEAQVASCVGAWDRLCRAIETRIPNQNQSQPSSTSSTSSSPSGPDADNPLVASAILDAASVPDPSFARSFLTCARRPQFSCIAPGLVLPPSDASAFVALQSFAKVPRSEYTVPPVCMFPAADKQRSVRLAGTINPFLMLQEFYSPSTDTHTPSRTSAGLYIAAVQRNGLDEAEEGFRLLLPFTLNDSWSGQARMSDGLHLRSSPADLFQHGFKPFGGGAYRPQRLERLLEHWRKLIEDGVWSVGPEGVQGTIDTFRDADSDGWLDYCIPPTW